MLKEVDVLNREFKERLASDKEKLNALFEKFDVGSTINPLSFPPDLWGNVHWDFMGAKKRDEILSSFFRFTLKRGIEKMPLYSRSQVYKGIKPEKFNSLSDLCMIPVLLKDGNASKGAAGFRQLVQKEPGLLRPADVHCSVSYESGGTKGNSTPTFITQKDMEIEGHALAYRCFLPGGFHSGVSFYNFYNPTHKGGRLIEDAAKLLGKQNILTRRPEDDLELCINKIKAYKTSVIAAIQPPLTEEANMKKGGGVSFINLFGKEHTVFGRKHNDSTVHRAFITGFQIPQPIIELSKDINMDLFTTWGASEALPGATSTILGPETRLCKYNNQHLILGPHVLSVVKMEENGIVSVRAGEDGILLVTTVAREGTLFFNYAIGDKATVIADSCDCGRTTPVIGNIRRVDNPGELVVEGCRYC